ncbi:MAG TPA: hypothetical protein P5345_00400 [Candidatus Paceibacterota bacterium]|nr:hypothetical protein [Candidatus Paceibacterota bacterium]
MAKNLDAIANQKNGSSQENQILDLKKISIDNAAEKKASGASSQSISPSPNEAKTTPTTQKKLQPIWWTIEKKYAVNSWLSLIFFTAIIICSIVAITSHNWTFLAILILGTILFILLFLQPRKTWYRLTPEGFYIDDDFIPYRDVKYYSILETTDKNFIILETDKLLDKHIFLPFKKEKTAKIREFLNNFLKEREIKPSLLDLLANIF